MQLQSDIVKVLRNIFAQMATISTRLNKAAARVQELEAALTEARNAHSALETEQKELLEKSDALSKIFPAEDEAAQAQESQAKPQQNEGTARTSTTNQQSTIVNDMCQVMGTRTMRAGEIAEALCLAGLERPSNNFKGYISTLLSSHDVALVKDGRPVYDATGKRVRVRVFEKVNRGAYRVAPQFLPNNEVTLSESTGNGLLRQYGLDEKDIPRVPTTITT